MTSVPDMTHNMDADFDAGSDDTSTEVETLRRQLLAERERVLHAVDAQRGAEAIAAQFEAEIRELQYRIHVREAEVRQLQEVLAVAGIGQTRAQVESETATGSGRSGNLGRYLLAGLRRRGRALLNPSPEYQSRGGQS